MKPSGRVPSVLVVDDHADTRAYVRAVLEAAGYDVRTAPEGARALAMLGMQPTDLLITDIFMPGQEGFETLSRCKREFPGTRMIVMSAGTVPGMQHDFLAAAGLLGAATLRKPFAAVDLVALARKVLARDADAPGEEEN